MRTALPSLTDRNRRPTQCLRFALLWPLATLAPALPLYSQETPARPPLDLEGFVISADRLARPNWAVAASSTVIDGPSLEQAGVEYVSDALRMIPGLAIVQSGSKGATTSLFLRGGESDHVKVLIDGVPVNEPGGAFDFGALTTDNIERIEVVRGPGSSLYGSDAMSGVIQIFTRRGRGAPVGRLDVRAGSFGTRQWQAGLSGGTDALSYALSAGSNDSDGVLEFNNGHMVTTLGGRLAVQPDIQTDLSLTARYQNRRFHFPTDGSGALVDRNAFTFGDSYVFSADWLRAWTETLSTQVRLSVNDVDTGTDDAPDGPADTLGFFGFQSLSQTSRKSMDVRTVWSPRAGSTLAAGYELERQGVHATSESTSEFGTSPSSSDDRRWNRAYYAQFTRDFTRVALSGGARIEDNDRFGTAATYRAGVAWRSPSTGTRLRTSAGTAIKEPTFFENFAGGFAVGNPDLSPERSKSLDLGIDQDIGSLPAALSVTAFDQRFRNLIQFSFPALVEGGPNYHNLAEASSRGVEVTLQSQGLNGAEFQVGYAYVDTEVRDPGSDEGPGGTFVEGARLLRRPTHSITASARVRGSEYAWVDIGLRRIGDRDDRDFSSFPTSEVVLPAYTAVDVSIEFRVLPSVEAGPGFTLTARLENALDKDYQEVWAFDAPGRALYLGGRVTLGRETR